MGIGVEFHKLINEAVTKRLGDTNFERDLRCAIKRINELEEQLEIVLRVTKVKAGAQLNAGAPWSATEDELLKQEFQAAVATIANRHQRSIGAIRCRIQQKSLVDVLYADCFEFE